MHGVASAEDFGGVGPEAGGVGGTLVILIAIRGEDEWETRVGVMRKHDQAHARSIR